MTCDQRALNWDSIKTLVGETADPAAGANPAAVTVPAGKRWLLMAVTNRMVAAVAAADRVPIFVLKHDGTNITGYLAFGAITANQDCYTSIIPGAYSNDQSGIGTLVIGAAQPLFDLPPGAVFQLTYGSIQAADDAGKVYYAYKEIPA